jgi:multicomponent Na+:H+ antiporter subunit E
MIPLVFVLFFIYLAMTGTLVASNIVVGFLLAVGSAWLLQPQRRTLAWRRLPGAVFALLYYLLYLLWDLIQSGFQVAQIVLRPQIAIDPGIVAIPSGTDSELATALSAHAISVTPGELVVEIDEEGVMYTHMLDVSVAVERVEEAQQLRRSLLRRIFI